MMTRLLRDFASCKETLERSVSFPEYPTQVRRIVLVLEDRRFYVHPGFDWRSIVRVFVRRFQRQRAGGASTITQQFVRTVTNRRERKFYRKFREIILAFALERHFKKTQIIDAYLYIAFFGSGLIGIESISMALFKRPVEKLNLNQAAVLAACLKYPMPHAPRTEWSIHVTQRANYGLKRYFEDDWVRNCPMSEFSSFRSKDLSKSYTSPFT